MQGEHLVPQVLIKWSTDAVSAPIDSWVAFKVSYSNFNLEDNIVSIGEGIVMNQNVTNSSDFSMQHKDKQCTSHMI
jgi:hypothetical protein